MSAATRRYHDSRSTGWAPDQLLFRRGADFPLNLSCAAVKGGLANCRAAELADTRGLLSSWQRCNGGGIAFIVGPPAVGRSLFLDQLAHVLQREAQYPVVRGGFDGSSGAFRGDAESKADTAEDAGKVLTVLLRVLGLPPSVATLLDTVIERSSAAVRLLDRLAATSAEPADTWELTAQLLLAAASSGLILLLDDLDAAGAEWCSELLYFLAPAVASGERLIVVATGVGPDTPPEPEASRSDFLFVAADVMQSTAASRSPSVWVPLRPLTRQDWQLALRCSDDVVIHLWDASGGRVGVAQRLVLDWLQRKILVSDSDGFVTFDVDADINAIESLFRRVLQRVRNLTELDTAAETMLVRTLQVGALEGETFTADAAAMALGRDRDEIIDLLDPELVLGTHRPEGLLYELPHEAVGGPDGQARHLCRYRFAGPGIWLAFRNGGLSAEQRRELAQLLRDALRALYPEPIADQRIRLVTPLADGLGEMPSSPKGKTPTLDLLIWRAHMHLTAPRQAWSRPRYLRAARALADACTAGAGIVAIHELRVLADGATQFADASDDLFLRGRARAESSRIASSERDRERQLKDGDAAMALLESAGNRAYAAAVAVGLGAAHVRAGDRKEGARLLEQAAREGTPSTAAHALTELAAVVGLETSIARTYLSEALLLWGDTEAVRPVKSTTFRRLACIELRRGALRRAQRMAEVAVRLAGENAIGLASFYVLCNVQIALGDFEAARLTGMHAVTLSTRIDSPEDVAVSMIVLAPAEIFGGYPVTAEPKIQARLANLFSQIRAARAAGAVGPGVASDPSSAQRLIAVQATRSFA